MIIPLSEKAQEILGKAELVILTERVDTELAQDHPVSEGAFGLVFYSIT